MINYSRREGPMQTPLNDRMTHFIRTSGFDTRLGSIMRKIKIQRMGSFLPQIKQLYEEEFGPVVMNKFHDQLLGRPGSDIYVTGREELIQPLIIWFRDSLITHKEAFQYIFETSRGSIYFVSPELESLRFKMAHPEFMQGLFGPVKRATRLEKPYLQIESAMPRCYFITEEERERIFTAWEAGRGKIKLNLQTTQIARGTIPLEVGASYNSQARAYSSIDTDINGILHLGDNVSYFHPGTEITKIIYRK